MTEGRALVPLAHSVADVRHRMGPRAREQVREAYRWMVLGRALDARMQGLQRQGRVGFYGATTGNEAVNVAAGLLSAKEDWIYPGLREQLVALVRGHPLATYAQHLFATSLDPSRGRQMPCHPSAVDVHYVSMSSVIGTQITHAVGTARAIRLRRAPGVVLAFFGDGATSANDFHAGLNLAGIDRLPIIFVCVNNQWAISMPVERQSAVATLSSKAAAYGFEGTTVDGTDYFAVHDALSQSLAEAHAGRGPRLLEFQVYRMTAHSSSDDPSKYQPADWALRAGAHDPVLRLGAWLDKAEWLSRSEGESLSRAADQEVRRVIDLAEATPPPDPGSLFEGVVAEPLSTPDGFPDA
ncbi:MAG: thiamine pyrophosphate-dependent dehydrogenase E1 component subunit alpha [Thermoplasmata archaeon]